MVSQAALCLTLLDSLPYTCTMHPEIIKELQDALNLSDGIVHESSIMIMTTDAYREAKKKSSG